MHTSVRQIKVLWHVMSCTLV